MININTHVLIKYQDVFWISFRHALFG